MEISLNVMVFKDFFYKEMLTSLISFSSRNTSSLNRYLKQTLFRLKIMFYYNFFVVANRTGSETSHKLPN